MIQNIKRSIVAGLLILGIGLVFVPADASAVNVIAEQCTNTPDAAICKDQDAGVGEIVTTIVNVLLFVIGAISVLMIIIGGLMYATSTGDSGRITKAKNTIMYAVVGLVVAFLAYAIVNFVIMQFVKP